PRSERISKPRGITLVADTPCEYKEVSYAAYTNELGAVNLGGVTTNCPEFWRQPQAGLHYFRGGYEHVVDDEVKACLIASGLVDESNFTPANLPSTGFGFGGFGEGPFGG